MYMTIIVSFLKGSKMKTFAISISLLSLLFVVCFVSDTPGQCTPYLGQPAPTAFVKRFSAAGFIANQQWFWHGTPVFSPDGQEMYFVKYFTDDSGTEIWFTKCENGQWSVAQKAPFSIKNLDYFDNNPFFCGSNDTLYFHSRRNNGFIQYVVRSGDGWSSPQTLNVPVPANLRAGLQFCISGNKTVYYEIDSDTSSGWETNIYSSKFENGQYSEPVNLGPGVNSDSTEILGYIDPQERFLIFASKRPGSLGYHDLYLSIRNSDNTWRNAVSLGLKVNGAFEDISPVITPDGNYFFYQTWKTGDLGYNPYWVSSKFVFDLVTDLHGETETVPNSFTLGQNYPNPFNPTTTIAYQLHEQAHVQLSIANALGETLYEVVNEIKPAGTYEYTFDADNLPTGVYFYQLIAGESRAVRKMILLR